MRPLRCHRIASGRSSVSMRRLRRAGVQGVAAASSDLADLARALKAPGSARPRNDLATRPEKEGQERGEPVPGPFPYRQCPGAALAELGLA